MIRLCRFGAATALVLVAGVARADDSCPMAQNGLCEDPVFGGGYCVAGTDTTDCASAFILPDSASRDLGVLDIRFLSATELRLARNEIFARHGYAFGSADLQQFFGGRSWYAPAGQDVSLSATEQANVALLRQAEAVPFESAPDAPRAPDGLSLPPWSAWQAIAVHADGARVDVTVDGPRARLVDVGSSQVQVIRPDKDEIFAYDADPANADEWGAIWWWGLFPPRLLEPLVHGHGIVPQPIGRETLLGESVTRVRLDWEDPVQTETLHGEAWLTDDGVFIQVAVEGVFAECCGGDENIPWRLEYHLEDLRRGRPDPALFAPPADRTWVYPG